MPIDPSSAIALKSDALYVRDTITVPSATGEAKIISPFAARAAAVAEVARVRSFLTGPVVRDRVTVDGARRALVGKRVTLAGGPANGSVVFVLGADEGATDTVLTVLRRLS